MTNSRDFFIISYDYLLGLREIYTIGGFVHMVPVQATVTISLLSPSPQLTITTGTGYNIFPGLKSILIILKISLFIFSLIVICFFIVFL